ncbi:MAG TPA: DUF4384 domain-containing protein [Pyrinomonadaceae bacterium]|nr:DUF4384 domain-containing protein [Pyrinomonadaceae bacterium]
MKVVIRIGTCFASTFLLICGIFFASNAQTPSPTPLPEITSDSFSRSLGTVDAVKQGTSVFVFKKPTYKLKRTVPRAKRVVIRTNDTIKASGSNAKLPVDDKAPEVWEQVGVTIWRLEAEPTGAAGDSETARLQVKGSGRGLDYLPKRVAADTAFGLGDKVRLSIESPRSGYLYIIDREIYAGDKLGEPYLIFPTRMAHGGENRVEPGRVIDIPAQGDTTPFFELKPVPPNANWLGEMLTVIVSPEPLKDMGLPDKPSPIPVSMVDAMEDKYLKDFAEYEQDGTVGKTYTRTEKEAGADGKRQLTQNDPYPQTVYSVKVRPKEPMIVRIKLALK